MTDKQALLIAQNEGWHVEFNSNLTVTIKLIDWWAYKRNGASWEELDCICSSPQFELDGTVREQIRREAKAQQQIKIPFDETDQTAVRVQKKARENLIHELWNYLDMALIHEEFPAPILG